MCNKVIYYKLHTGEIKFLYSDISFGHNPVLQHLIHSFRHVNSWLQMITLLKAIAFIQISWIIPSKKLYHCKYYHTTSIYNYIRSSRSHHFGVIFCGVTKKNFYDWFLWPKICHVKFVFAIEQLKCMIQIWKVISLNGQNGVVDCIHYVQCICETTSLGCNKNSWRKIGCQERNQLLLIIASDSCFSVGHISNKYFPISSLDCSEMFRNSQRLYS